MTVSDALTLASIDSLPVDAAMVAEHFEVKVLDYATCTALYQCSKDELYSRGRLGFSFIDTADSIYVIAINENVHYQLRQRWSLAHELGHILLGHLEGECDLSDKEERSADDFAAQLLAPLTVLHFCGVSSASEIAQLCRISEDAAQNRFRELQRLRNEDSRSYRSGGECLFLASEEQKEMFQRFGGFISSYITRKHRSLTNWRNDLAE